MTEARQPYLVVGLGTCGLAAGAARVVEALEAALAEASLAVKIVRTGCIGLCEHEVLVQVCCDGETVSYGRVTPEAATRIVREHLVSGRAVEEYRLPPLEELDFLRHQHRVVLSGCGRLDPEDLDDYLAHRGYQALRRAVQDLTPAQVVDLVKESGLRGRGGAGFPTGLKWELAAAAPGAEKYVVCNADEGDPGAFMDRSVLESDPHRVLEGLALAAYAIGAAHGYIYVRAEYPLAVARLRRAITAALERGYLGEHILGSDFSFTITLKEGAGAFVCGEETALIASLEGRRGMPRPRPPFPATHGLWGCPTCINNVETLANVAPVIIEGPEVLAGLGAGRNRGTKVFALAGKVANTGLAEVPLGTTLRDLVYGVGGGVRGGGRFKAIQIGGPSGGCLPEAALDLPIEYETLVAAGAMMGSGGLIVLDDSTCMVELARFFLGFVEAESCGKCTPCREGTRRMRELLDLIVAGRAELADLDRLEELARVIKDTALCGLGQSAPNPVLSTLRYFREEYEAHVRDRRCPAGVCAGLSAYSISEEACRGCGLCRRACPAGAIAGAPRAPHRIDPAKCLRCGACVSECRFGAIAGGASGRREAAL